MCNWSGLFSGREPPSDPLVVLCSPEICFSWSISSVSILLMVVRGGVAHLIAATNLLSRLKKNPLRPFLSRGLFVTDDDGDELTSVEMDDRSTQLFCNGFLTVLCFFGMRRNDENQFETFETLETLGFRCSVTVGIFSVIVGADVHVVPLHESQTIMYWLDVKMTLTHTEFTF